MSMGTEQISDKTEKQKRDGYRSFYNRVTKRVLDFVLALAGSVIVTPILLVIGIFIAIEDGLSHFLYAAARRLSRKAVSHHQASHDVQGRG